MLILTLSLCCTSKTGKIRTAKSAKICVARKEEDINKSEPKPINSDVQENCKSSAPKIKNTDQQLLVKKKNANAFLKAEHTKILKSNLEA